ncbi:MAG: DNA topoisomerase VI subunit B, partial [Nanoarchaeota archaeon]
MVNVVTKPTDTETTAYQLAEKQKAISIAEFFEKNRHLLGFDNKRKALLTAVKEAVDNSLDACEEARIIPEVLVSLTELAEDRFQLVVEDNGPGIVKQQIPHVFARLLYGSKFHTLAQRRGQQGLGISAAILYAQLTTGKPAKIVSKISPKKPAQYYELRIDVQKNTPEIVKEEEVSWQKDHGTKIEMELEATYLKGMQSVDEYLKQTSIINPNATIIYTSPKAEQIIYSRATDKLAALPKEIKPHPYGVEIGLLMRMLASTTSRTLQSFLMNEFSRVGSETAKEVCRNAALLPNQKASELGREHAEKLIAGIKATKIIAPPA